ncbi:MAG: VCBS repeat-containing protein [Planctomycetes bacterium]|nr:VCBS repeat-containing protein [Planctomycetota bacterium]
MTFSRVAAAVSAAWFVIAAVRTQCPLFGATADANVSGAVLDVWTVDLDRDGDLDFAFRSGGIVHLRRNAGATSIVLEPSLPSVPTLAAGEAVQQVAFGDWDRDGFVDVAATVLALVGNLREVRLQVWRNTGLGPVWVGFASVQQVLLSPAHLSVPLTNLAAGDLDVDGRLDLVADDGRGFVHVLRGAGSHGMPTGSFLPPVARQTFLGGNAALVLTDVNADGAVDAVMPEMSNLQNRLNILKGGLDAEGRPNGTFGGQLVAAVLPQGTRRTLALRDLDGDGLPEFVAAFFDEVRVYRGLGDFRFAPPLLFPRLGCEGVVVGDYDRNGTLDLAVPCSLNMLVQPNLWVLQDVAGAATWSYHLAGTGYPITGAAHDVDGDGQLDLAIGKEVGRLTTVRNTCAVTPPPTITVTSPNGGEGWTAGKLYPIAWTSTVPVAAYDVDVSHDDGLTWQPVARGVAATTCTWFATEPSTNRGRVRVAASGLPVFADGSDAPFTVGGPGLAAVAPLGPGCGTPTVPVATAGVPRLGAVCPLTVAQAAAASIAGFWLSLPQSPPLGLGAGCSLHLAPAHLSVLGLAVTDAAGSAAIGWSIPDLPALLGLEAATQAAVLTSGSPLGLQFSNGLRLLLGR